MLNTFSGVVGGRSGETHDATARVWRPVFWLYAMALPMMLFAFEMAQNIFYPATRAPNVSLPGQLALMFVFYASWALAPRGCWYIAAPMMAREPTPWRAILLRVVGLGLSLSTVHLLFLALVLRIMHSPPGWGPAHLFQSFGEVWLGNAGVWLMVYAVAAAIILYKLESKPKTAAPPARYEVRDNGKTLSIPVTDIYWVKAAGNYAELHTARGVTMVRKTLSQVDKEIGASGFLKSHRSALVNGRHVLAIKPQSDGSGFTIELSDQNEAPLSRRQLSRFKELLKTVS